MPNKIDNAFADDALSGVSPEPTYTTNMQDVLALYVLERFFKRLVICETVNAFLCLKSNRRKINDEAKA